VAAPDAADASAGDFVLIPKHVVHRESNVGSTASLEVVTRSGTGPLTINVDGPTGTGRRSSRWRRRSRKP